MSVASIEGFYHLNPCPAFTDPGIRSEAASPTDAPHTMTAGHMIAVAVVDIKHVGVHQIRAGAG